MQKITLAFFGIFFLTFYVAAIPRADAILPAPGAVEDNAALWLKADAGGINWTDLSGQSTTINKVGVPSLVVSGMNFNPTVKIEAGSHYSIGTSIDRTAENDVHIFAVVKPSAVESGYVVGSSAGDNHRSFGADFFEAGTSVSFTKPNQDSGHIFDAEFHTDVVNGSKVYNNAAQVGVTTDTGGTALSEIIVGARDGSGVGVCEDCEIAEVIVYKGELDVAEQKRVRSYLAIKYGLTLSQDEPYSYLASNGLDAWNTNDNEGYKNDIFGIGRDTETGLDQQISRSANDVSGPIFSTDTDFESINGAHRIITTDSTYTIAGHDGDPLAFTDEYKGEPNTKLARAWRIDKSSNDIGQYYVAFPKSTIRIEGENPVLINEVTNSIISEVIDDGTHYYADLSPLGDGNSFTFASDPAIGPGGVVTGLGFWYKADSDTGAIDDGDIVSTWADQTVNRNTLTKVGTPELGIDSSDQINFNPTILFDGRIDGFTIPDQAFGAGDDSASFYSIFTSSDVSKAQHIINMGPVVGGSGENIGLQINGGFLGASINSFPLLASQSISDNVPVIGTIHTQDSDVDDIQFSLNGGLFQMATVGRDNRSIGDTGNTIGYAANGMDEFFSGKLAEIIAFNARHTELERKKLESQLAFKYGITLDQSTPTSYVDSDGFDVWNASDNAGYDNDIFGIGRDDIGVYSQQISQSTNDTTGPIFSTDTDFESINSTHRVIEDDMSFVTAGHNGEPLVFTETFKGESNTKLARHWKVDRSAKEVGPFYVAIPRDMVIFPGALPVLINALSNAVIGQLVDNGEFYYAEITSIVDGELFTFASNSADAPGFTIVQDETHTKLSESGSDEVFVTLDNPPISAVVISVSSSDITSAATSKNSLIFTPDNWNVAQELVVFGVDDADEENNFADITFSVDVSNSDPLYSTVENQIVRAIIFDDDTPGLEIIETQNTTQMKEKESDTFDITLLTPPSGDVIITITSDDSSEATVSPSTMTFTALNWDVSQTVTVIGIDDVTTGNDHANIVLSIDSDQSAIEYAELFDRNVPVTIIDEEGGGAPGFSISESSGNTVLSESTTDSFAIRLDAAPALDVTIDFTSENTGKATISPETVVFNNANWDIDQEVIVYGQSDTDALDDTIAIFANIDRNNSDNNFDDLAQKQIDVTVTDIDPFGLVIVESGGSTTLAENTSDAFTVHLNTPPIADVVVTIAIQDNTIASISPSTLTFTRDNWDSPQSVIISGVVDLNQFVDATTIVVSINDALSDNLFVDAADGTIIAMVSETLDTDGDGVPDVQEGLDGTSITDPTEYKDTDGDRHPDYIETLAGSDPLLSSVVPLDSDDDSVPDVVEQLQGTDPNISFDYKDTDGDGHPDYVENMATSLSGDASDVPSDRDSDGVPDVIEAQEETDPDNGIAYLDGDADIVPRYYEIHIDQTNHTEVLEYLDTDSGGSTDYEELLLWPNRNMRAGAITNPADDDEDFDGVPTAQEDAGLNGGDGNGDGILDSQQSHVATVNNPAVPSSSLTMEISGGCDDITDMSVQSETTRKVKDASADYPLGLVDFTLLCNTPGASTDVTVIFAFEYDTEKWTYKKYNPRTQVYSDIEVVANVRYSSRDVGGEFRTAVTFTLTDGDALLDTDGLRNGIITDPSGPALSVTPDVAYQSVPVYRFWSTLYNAHFYTKSAPERDAVIDLYDDNVWRYEGIVFRAHQNAETGGVPVYRFWSDEYESHFYTISEAEKAIATQSTSWEYEGVDYYAYSDAGTNRKAVYRFWSEEYTAYFYTNSAQEKDSTLNNDPHWDSYEGVVYYVPSI